MRTLLPLLPFLFLTICTAFPTEGSNELARREASIWDPPLPPPESPNDGNGHKGGAAEGAEEVTGKRKSRPAEPIPGVDRDWRDEVPDTTRRALCEACVTDCVRSPLSVSSCVCNTTRHTLPTSLGWLTQNTRTQELRGRPNECAQSCSEAYGWECFPTDNIGGENIKNWVAGGISGFQKALKGLRAPSWKQIVPPSRSPGFARVAAWA